MMKLALVVLGLVVGFSPFWVGSVAGCSQVDVQDPGEYLDKLQAICGFAPVVEGVPKQITEACAVIQRVRLEP